MFTNVLRKLLTSDFYVSLCATVSLRCVRAGFVYTGSTVFPRAALRSGDPSILNVGRRDEDSSRTGVSCESAFDLCVRAFDKV